MDLFLIESSIRLKALSDWKQHMIGNSA